MMPVVSNGKFSLFLMAERYYIYIRKWHPTPVLLTGEALMDRGAWRATVLGVLRVGHDLVTKPLSDLVQQMNRELPDAQAGFRKGRGTRDQIANICWIIKKARVPKKKKKKKSISALLIMPKPLTMDHNKLWKILQEMEIPDHLTCLLRNLYAGQEATVRTGHGKTDWFQIGKGVCQVCILSPYLFNLYAEYIM